MDLQTLELKLLSTPSKSHTLRAILFAALSSGKSRIENPLCAQDSASMIEACRLLGAKITVLQNALEIEGVSGIPHFPSHIDAGASGIVLRFVTALAALSSKEITISGSPSLCKQRPIKALADVLISLGVSIQYIDKEGFAPFKIKGPLLTIPEKVEIEGADSQPVSALFILFSFLGKELTLYVKNLGERPWLDMTLDWLKKRGAIWDKNQGDSFSLKKKIGLDPFIFKVPGDASSAAFPVIAALMSRKALTITGIDRFSFQGDLALFEELKKFGYPIDIENNAIIVKSYSHDIEGGSLDINPMVDALPILAVLATQMRKGLHIYNGAVVRTKECDRIAVMAAELTKIGAKVEEKEDGLVVFYSKLKGGIVDSHDDHRVAMALSVAGYVSKEPVTILGASCVEKSYPRFFEEMESLGYRVGLQRPALILVGQTGAGKSTVGALLAKKLKREFIDLDFVLERKMGMACRDIMALHGEDYFRSIETAELEFIKEKKEPFVLAVGGGALIKNREKILSMGEVICLEVSIQEYLERLLKEGSTQLMSIKVDREKRLRSLFQERESLFYGLKNIRVDGKSPEEIVCEIEERSFGK